MPTPQYTAMMHHSSSNSSDDLLAPSSTIEKKTTTNAVAATLSSRPFTLGRTTTAATTSLRPIYGRRSKSYDPRLNSRIRNDQRVPMDVKIIPSSRRSRHRRSENNVTRQRSEAGTKQGDDRGSKNGHVLQVCKESMSPDVADYQVSRRDHDQLIANQAKSSKRRLSYPTEHDKDEENNDHPVDNYTSQPAMKTTGSKKKDDRTKVVKRRRMKKNVNDDENIRPNHPAEDNLSFTETTADEKEEHNIQQSNKSKHRHSSTGRTNATTTTNNTITIRTKSKNGGIVIPSTKSHIKELRDLAKANNGTATQYKATYHTGAKPIHDKNATGSGSSSSSSSRMMIQVGQLIIKETSVTSKGNKGGNSYSFEGWKLPGSKQRDSSIYDSTRPKLVGVDEYKSSAVLLTTNAPHLIVDTALTTVDADRVRQFVMEAESGQTPMEFFACENVIDEDEDGGEGEEALFGGSMVSEEENEGGIDAGRKVLGDKSNTAGRTQLKGKVHKSPDMNLSNKYHKARTKSARKKRKSANISPTEPRKKRMLDSIVRFYVPESNGSCFGLIEGIRGGREEEGLSNVIPHRGRLLELPGAVLGGQWETRLVKDKAVGDGNEQSVRISLRHESSSLRSLENLLTGKDDYPDDGHFVSIIKPAIARTHSLIQHGVVQEEEVELDYDGREQISSNAFIGCISLVLFEDTTFLSSSEAIGESRNVASRFLRNCVPSNELQLGRELYGIVGNEHNSHDDENITGMLFPCNVSVDSDHVVLLLQNEEFQVSGIDVIFCPSKKNWSRQHPLTETLLDNHMNHIGSNDIDGEIMKRYIEKNIPSPMRPKPASAESNDNPVQSEEIEERSLDHKHSDIESLGFERNDQPDFDVNNDELSLAKDSKDDENVHRLEEESRTLKERIELLEAEKRLLEQQIADQPLVDTTNIAKSAECAVAANELADQVHIEPVAATLDPVHIEPAVTTLTTSTKSKKKAVADLFGDNDSLFCELTNKQAEIDSTAPKVTTVLRKKNAVKDLFGDSDSLFGVSTKKQISRRKSTGGLSNPRTSLHKQNRGRHSTGGLPNRRNSLDKGAPVRTQLESLLAPQRSLMKKRFVSTSHKTAEKGSLVLSKRADSSTVVTRPILNAETTRKSTLSERTNTNKSGRSTFPIESRGKQRLSTGTNASISKKSNVTLRKKVKVADLFEDDCGSMFGCAVKTPVVKKKAVSKSIEPSLIPNDAQSVSSPGGGSCSFGSLSTQSVGKAPTNAATDDGVVTPTQPFFDVYFGKETEVSNGGGRNDGDVSALQQAGTQPFFDYYFGQDLSGTNDDESTQYSMQPFHSVYYGGDCDDQSTLHSITSSFEIPTVPPSLYYFDNEGIVPERVVSVRPPFFDHYFGQLSDEESSTLLWSPSITSQQSPEATEYPPFFDHYHGQEEFDEQKRNVAAKASWRCGLASCVRFLVIGVLPALLPVLLLVSKQNDPNFSHQFDANDVNDIADETTRSWWSLKPWE